MDMVAVQAAAVQAVHARHAAVKVFRAGLPYTSNDSHAAAWRLVPSSRFRFSSIECEALIPENRSTYRRPHYRFVWWLDGKRVSAAMVQSMLGFEDSFAKCA